MSSNPRLTESVLRALDEVNTMLPPERRVAKSPEAPLAEPAGPLNSLALVNLIVALEDQIEQAFGIPLNLSEAPPEGSGNPLATVQALISFLETKLGLSHAS